MMRWLRDPLPVFVIAGASLFAAYRFLAAGEGEPIILGGAGLAVLLEEYAAVTGQRADEGARESIINDYYRREVLYREGLREGLHESDPRVREAIIERMQQRVSGELPEPTGRDLVNYYGDNMARYYREASMSVAQRFLRAEPADPTALLLALGAGEEPDFDAAPGGAWLPDYGESMLRGLFGAAILDALRTAPLQQWAGPFASPRGWHFLRVEARSPRELLPFERVRDQVLADYQADVLAARLADYVAARRDRYPLELPP